LLFLSFFLFPQVIGYSTKQAMIMGFSFTFIYSFLFMLTTQINHLCEELSIHRESDLKISPSWSIHQVNTAQNFSHDSLFWWVLAGGLNYQIEHHLFPGVNHEHLPNLKPIVQALCKKYSIKYTYENTYYEVFQKYISALLDLSSKHAKGSYEKEQLDLSMQSRSFAASDKSQVPRNDNNLKHGNNFFPVPI